MEKAIKNKTAKAVVAAIDVMFQALRWYTGWFHIYILFSAKPFHLKNESIVCIMLLYPFKCFSILSYVL